MSENMKKYSILVLTLVWLIAAGCFVPASAAASQSVVTQKETISASRKNYVMVKGEKLILSIKGYSGTISWKTSNRNVAAIGAKGLIAAKSKGTAKLTGKYGKKTIKLTVTVQSPVISSKKEILEPGGKKQLKVTGTNRTIKWKSADKKIAAVNSKGLVTAKSAGTTVVSAVIHGVSFSCEIGVKGADGIVPTPTPYPYVRVSQSQLKQYLKKVLSPYQSRYYLNSYHNDLDTVPSSRSAAESSVPSSAVPAYPANDPRQFSNITWKNTNPSVAALSGSVLKVKKAGTTTITASLTAKDGTKASVSRKITVTDMKKYYTTISVSQSQMSSYFSVSKGITRNGVKVIAYVPKVIQNKWVLAGYADTYANGAQFSMEVHMDNANAAGDLTRNSFMQDSIIKAWNVDSSGKTIYTWHYPSFWFEIPLNESVKRFTVSQMTDGNVRLMYVNKAALSKKKAGSSYGGIDVYRTIDGKAMVQVP